MSKPPENIEPKPEDDDQPEERLEPKPEDDGQPEDRLEFMLGPVENPDGTPLDPEETRRRLAKLRYDIEQLTALHGGEIREVGQHPLSQQTPTARANRIRQEADPAMAKAAEDTKALGASLSVGKYKKYKDKDCKVTEGSLLEINVRGDISKIIKRLAGIVKDSIPPGKIALGLKVGWLKLAALVQHDGEGKEEKD